MKAPNKSFLKMTLYAFIVSMLIAIPVFANWAASVTQEDFKLWKMWIKLAIDGYAEPMDRPGERPWWRF